MTDMYNTNLDKNHANFTPLSPLSFLQRSAEVYPNRLSIVHGSKKYTWSDTFKRSKQLASALTKKGVGKGDTVAVLCFNTPEIYEAHYGIPMIGAIINTINIGGKPHQGGLDFSTGKMVIGNTFKSSEDINQQKYYTNDGVNPTDSNWGSYQYVSLSDIMNNFLLMYAGNHSLINNVVFNFNNLAHSTSRICSVMVCSPVIHAATDDTSTFATNDLYLY